MIASVIAHRFAPFVAPTPFATLPATDLRPTSLAALASTIWLTKNIEMRTDDEVGWCILIGLVLRYLGVFVGVFVRVAVMVLRHRIVLIGVFGMVLGDLGVHFTVVPILGQLRSRVRTVAVFRHDDRVLRYFFALGGSLQVGSHKLCRLVLLVQISKGKNT